MRQPLLILLLLAALGGSAWFLLGGGADEGDHLPTYDGIPDPIPEDDTQESLAGSRDDGEAGVLRTAPGNTGEGAAVRRRPVFDDDAAIFGQVVDLDGNAVAGATIELRSGPARVQRQAGALASEAEATATSDGSGTFRVGPVTSLPVRVRAFAEGYAATEREVGTAQVEIRLELDRGGNLELEVVDVEGNQVAGATAVFEAGSVAMPSTTDAGGKARFTSLPAGEGTLRVYAEGKGAARDTSVAIIPQETLERTLVLPGIQAWPGTVMGDDNKALKGARVTVHYPQIPEIAVAEPIPTDSKGRFQIPVHVAVGQTLEVHVVHSEYAERRVLRQYQPQQPLVIQMSPPGPPLEGRVIDGETGESVSGARITWWLETGPEEGLPATTSRADGSFRIEQPRVAATGWNLAATGPGGGLGTAWVRAIAKDQTAPPIVLRLRAGGAIQGQVTTPDGEPVARAEVRAAVDVAGTRQMRVPGISPWAMRQVLSQHGTYTTNTHTDAEGYYELGPLPALSYRLEVHHGSDTSADTEPLNVFPGARVTANLVFAPGAGIHGTVVDENRESIAGARVIARRADPAGVASSQVSGVSNSEGAFVLAGANQGTWRLYVSAPGYQPNVVESVQGGVHDVEIRMERQGTIEGVVMEGGRPFPSAFQITVRQTSSTDTNSGLGVGGFRRNQGFQSREGAFRIEGLSAGEWELDVSSQDGFVSVAPQRVTLRAGETRQGVRLELARGARITGTVRDAGGQAMVGIPVTAYGKDGRSAAKALSDNKGAFVLKGLSAGPYAIEARPRDRASFQRRVTVTPGDEQTIELRAEPSGSLLVEVVDAEGQPIEGAQPRVIDELGRTHTPNFAALRAEGRMPDPIQRALTTGADGKVQRHHLPPGRYTIDVYMRGYKVSGKPPTIQVTGGGTAQVKVTLEPV